MSLPSGLASSRWASAPVSSGIASSCLAALSSSSVAAVAVSLPCPDDNKTSAARCPSSPRDTRPSILDGTKPIVKMENPLPEGASGLKASRWASSPQEVCSDLGNLTTADEPTYRVENPLKTGALGYRASRRATPHTATTAFASTSSHPSAPVNKNNRSSTKDQASRQVRVKERIPSHHHGRQAEAPTGEQSHSFFDIPHPSASAVMNSIPDGNQLAPRSENPLSPCHAESAVTRNPLMGPGLASSVWAATAHDS